MGWRERLGLGARAESREDPREQVRDEVVGRYTLDDRPVELRRSDGALTCLVLDMTTGNLVPDPGLVARLDARSAGDLSVLTPAAFDALVGGHRADLVVRWAERLCG